MGDILLTGATSGLGRAAAEAILAGSPRSRLIAAGRDPTKLAATIRELSAVHGPDRVEALDIDLIDATSVRTAAATLAARPRRLDALVCNAGVQFTRPDVMRPDGVDATFAVNHLGHFLLIRELINSGHTPRRIVVIASGTHDPAQKTGFPTPSGSVEAFAYPRRAPDFDAKVAGARAYATSKLCNIMMALALARRLSPGDATALSFDPGLMPGTGLARDHSGFERFAWHRVLPFLPRRLLRRSFGENVSTARESALHLAALATSDRWEGETGRYVVGDAPVSPSAQALDVALQEDLWRMSESLCSPAGAPLTSVLAKPDA